jgi:hypothetical protein
MNILRKEWTEKENINHEKEKKKEKRKDSERRKKTDSSVKAVITVPYTPISELARRLKESE